MSGWSVVRWTGALGLAAIVVQLVGFIFGFAAGASADFNDPNKLLAFAKNSHFSDTTALFLFLIGFALFIGFLAGLRAIAVSAAPQHEWLPPHHRLNTSGSPRPRSRQAWLSPWSLSRVLGLASPALRSR